MTKLSLEDLLELTSADGGKFAVESLAEARAFCRKIATSHYENFPVGSILVDKKNRAHFYSVYAFARIADDIADEFSDNKQFRIDALENLANLLDESINKTESLKNPLFISLVSTIKSKNIPLDTLKKLLIAFKRDILFGQPENLAELEDYCSYSANPIGELVLRIYNCYNDQTADLSDSICTGLQMVNFWQDFSRDLPVGRLYVPKDLICKYNLNNNDILGQQPDKIKFAGLLEELYITTEKYFTIGSSILKYLKPFRLRTEIALTLRGGRLILEKTKLLGAEILRDRPKLRKADYLKLVILAFIDGLNYKNRTG